MLCEESAKKVSTMPKDDFEDDDWESEGFDDFLDPDDEGSEEE